MARKRKSTKLKSPGKLFDDRLRIILGILSIFLAIYLLLAFISYFFTWKIDQSFEWERVFSSAQITVENWSGKTGAYLASLFINKSFGLASFVVPFLLLIIGFRLFKVKLVPLKKTIRYSLIGGILLSLILGYILGNMDGYLGSGLGGAHGYIMAQWLNALVGKVGTAFILVLFTATFIIFSFANPQEAIEKFRSWVFSLQHLFAGRKVEKGTLDNLMNEQDEEDEAFASKEVEKDTGEADKEEEHETTPQKEDISPDLEPISPADSPTSGKKEEEEVELTIEQKENMEEQNGSNIAVENYDPTLDLASYQLPPLELLDEHGQDTQKPGFNEQEIIDNKNRIVETLANYKIQIDKIKATVGPTVTLYEIIPAPGIRISKIKNLENDIALSLAALGIRIIAPIPGRGTIGIEVPNQNPEIVSMRSIIQSKKFREAKYGLAIGLGKTISNETYVIDLAKMPHLLVAGATGQGKSVGLNTIITSLLYKKHPAQLKFVLIDPKKVELSIYSTIEKHFLAKLPDEEEAIITDTQKVITTLNSLCIEMDDRYDLLKKAQVRNIKEYNEKFIARRLNPEKGHRHMPYIVVIVDEFADLIMTAGKEIEGPIARLAQLARAIGIHLIIATQRPSTNIITGVIKANFPARIGFRVTSMVDSRTILDSPGANQLIGRGDMLISTGSDLTRLQCAFVDTPELERITEFIGAQQGYPSAFELPEYVSEEAEASAEVDLSKRDALFDEAARLIVRHQQGSTSLIQRKFSIGYNRAGRIIDQLEAANIVGPFEGSKARQVLIQDEYTLEQYLKEFN
mgnify:CR=1 FL=1